MPISFIQARSFEFQNYKNDGFDQIKIILLAVKIHDQEKIMSSFVQEFMESMGPQVVGQMASNLKVSPSAVQAILPQLVPMIITGLKKQKDDFGGEARVDHILNKYGNPDSLGDIAGLLAGKAKQAPDASLGGLLGTAGPQAANMLSKQFKIKPNQVAQMITMMSPLVLGFLSQKKNQGAGLSGIASMLDQDGDGSILDDVAGFLLKGAGGGRSGGALGSLLGSLLKKR
ncbi:MAG: DUF937 domain-containing protein [Calditrichaeota bacterium]|nr:MAG: DUF937 domain-containing protein [Calditrichota bacterium]